MASSLFVPIFLRNVEKAILIGVLVSRFAVEKNRFFAVLNWRGPLYLEIEITEWQIFIQEGNHPNMSHSVVKPTVLNSANISARSYEHSMVVNRCETYTVIIRTILEQGSELY